MENMMPRIFVLFGIFVFAMAQVPIPKRMVGYTFGHGKADAPVQIEVYVGPLCPDSKAALPTMINLANSYGPDNLRLVTHLFPLPYHHNAFIAAKGAHIVSRLTNNNGTYGWISGVYASIDSFGNQATYDMSQKQVELKFQILAESFGLSASDFSKLMQDEDIEEDTRLGWKYTATRGVAWTPAFMVNDVLIQANPTWTVSQWKQIIDPLLNKQMAKKELKVGEPCKFGEKRCEYLPGKVECCKDGENCIPNVGCRC